MTTVEEAVIARLSRSGIKFEILVDPENALAFKSGKEVPFDDLVVSKEVYEDSKKGERASVDDINKAFGTNNFQDVCKQIILKGDVQLTTEQRNKMIEEKTRKIAAIIAKKGINPQTGQPNPIERVLRAMEEARIKIELHLSAESQVENIVKLIQPIMPIRIEKMKVSISVAPRFSGKVASIVRGVGKVMHEQWNTDGSYSCMVELDAGSHKELVDKLNSVTHGENEIKVIK